MLFIPLYLTLLFIAPQLWVEPFVGIRVDYYIYPAWLLWVVATGRGPELFRFRAQGLLRGLHHRDPDSDAAVDEALRGRGAPDGRGDDRRVACRDLLHRLAGRLHGHGRRVRALRPHSAEDLAAAHGPRGSRRVC